MTERTRTIKGLISGQVDMGTFGLVELELLAIEKEIEALRQPPVISGADYKNIFGLMNEINSIMWDSFMFKDREFGRRQGEQIMKILEKWAENH